MFENHFNEWLKMNSHFSPQPLLKFYQKNQEFYQHLAQEQFGMISNNLAHFSNQLKKMQQAQLPNELLELNKECLAENIKLITENSQKWAQLQLSSFQEYFKLWETEFSSHADCAHSSKKSEKEDHKQ